MEVFWWLNLQIYLEKCERFIARLLLTLTQPFEYAQNRTILAILEHSGRYSESSEIPDCRNQQVNPGSEREGSFTFQAGILTSPVHIKKHHNAFQKHQPVVIKLSPSSFLPWTFNEGSTLLRSSSILMGSESFLPNKLFKTHRLAVSCSLWTQAS